MRRAMRTRSRSAEWDVVGCALRTPGSADPNQPTAPRRPNAQLPMRARPPPRLGGTTAPHSPGPGRLTGGGAALPLAALAVGVALAGLLALLDLALAPHVLQQAAGHGTAGLGGQGCGAGRGAVRGRAGAHA